MNENWEKEVNKMRIYNNFNQDSKLNKNLWESTSGLYKS